MYRVDARPGMSNVYVCLATKIGGSFEISTIQETNLFPSLIPFSLLVVDCGYLTNPENGHINTPNGTTFGNKAIYTCDPGYTLSSQAFRVCGADRNWTLSAPFCESKRTAVDTTIKFHY